MAKPQTLELCRVHLMDSVDDLRKANIAQQYIDRILRIRAAFNLWNSYPCKKEAEIRDFIMRQFKIDKSAAYEDIQIIKVLLGNFQETTKEYHRFKFNAWIEKAYDVAERKQNPIAMVASANAYGKFNKLDQEDVQKIPYEDIVPQPFEPTSDPTVIGIKQIPNIQEKIRAMKAKYMQDIAEDITFEEVDFNEDDIFNEKANIL